MPSPTINAAGQPWSAGASWLTNYGANYGTQETTDFVNGSNGLLYPGDVVVVGTSTTTPDVNALNVTSTTTALSPYVVGVVGGRAYNPLAPTATSANVGGGFIPEQLSPARYDACNTNSNTTVNDTSCVATDLFKSVVGPGIPVGAYITAVTPGVSFTISVAATATAAVTLFIGPQPAALGPGFLGYPVGNPVPVITRGWGYIFIGGNTVAAGAILSTSATARVAQANTVTAYVATSPGTFIAVALEAQSAGVQAPDGSAGKLIRCWIDKF